MDRDLETQCAKLQFAIRFINRGIYEVPCNLGGMGRSKGR